MVALKCKMCGGDLTVVEGMTVCECEYCGSKQTIPTVDDEKKLIQFSRANRLRTANEFDKAAGIYEAIVAEFPEEAEAYWGLVLCRYGIEYVDDPLTGKKIPTCHRSSFDSVMDDADFEQALENADPIARRVYREEAKQIEDVRKRILEVSEREDPYDIFICYKETADDGQRTLDSVLAQDVYDMLTENGYRVFFSRVSLEDKLGVEYEPYIFAALTSAKIMLVFGTDYEYYNAVWVKNEWSRFLQLIARGEKKVLIPCYKNIDAYDMPKEFARLQAQDMGKVGAAQDLLRGIKKILGEKATTSQATLKEGVIGEGKNTAALLTRGFNALEDGAIEEAHGYFDEALSFDATSAEAYLGLFMADIKARDRENAKEIYVSESYRENRYWKRANQYAAGDLLKELNNWEEEKKKKEGEEKSLRSKRASEIQVWRENLRTGQFELPSDCLVEKEGLQKAIEESLRDVQKALSEYNNMPQHQEAERLKTEIDRGKRAADALGFFKGKEKKKLLEEVAVLEMRYNECCDALSKKNRYVQATESRSKELENKYAERESFWKAEIQFTVDSYDILENNQKALTFGRYEEGHGIRPIEWSVLKVEGQKALVISKYCIDCQPFNNKEGGTWNNCTLRTWLNSVFLNKAFTNKEQERILTTTVTEDTEIESETYTVQKYTTHDKVFLLSTSEAQLYFASDELRRCHGTAYCEKQQMKNWAGGDYSLYKRNSRDWYHWRLRTVTTWNTALGTTSWDAHYVDFDGRIKRVFGEQMRGDLGIRPVIWIELDWLR